jgi:hypothetical protein
MVEATGSWHITTNTARHGIICEAASVEAIRGATPIIYQL